MSVAVLRAVSLVRPLNCQRTVLLGQHTRHGSQLLRARRLPPRGCPPPVVVASSSFGGAAQGPSQGGNGSSSSSNNGGGHQKQPDPAGDGVPGVELTGAVATERGSGLLYCLLYWLLQLNAMFSTCLA